MPLGAARASSLLLFSEFEEDATLLVLSRKIGEEIVIGNDVRVRVLEIIGNRVRLGITAPPDVAVLRLGIYVEITGETRSAPGRDGPTSQ